MPASPPPPPSDAGVTAVLCFTGAHARLHHSLATLRRSGHPLFVRRCTTLVDFARELTRHDADLVGIDCGPGNLRLADALAVLRRAGPRTPVLVISEQSAETLAVTAWLDSCRILPPDDIHGLADLVRGLRVGGDAAPPGEGSGTPTAPGPDGETQADPADRQALLEALRPPLLAQAARAGLAVLRIAPDPGAKLAVTLLRILVAAGAPPAFLARLDGGGYGALLELADPGAGVALAHRVRESLLEHLPAGSQVAIGMSPPRPGDGALPEVWLARATEACDVAARTDHGYAVLSRAPVVAPSARDIPGLLQEALVSNQLVLQFQPIVSLRGDARQYYETLVRLPSATAGELLPADFFGPARASGLIGAVDHWVIRHAIRRLARERATNRRIHLFIPLSAETLADERVLLAICDELRDAQAAGDWLTFQLRPADIRAHAGRTRQLVEGLRQIRCRLALDRYEADASCRDLTQGTPFDFAKLPPDVTRNLHDDPERLERLRGVVFELERRGVRSVATGVEDSRTLAYLWTLGVDYAQGFFLQEPSDAIAYDTRG